MYVSSIRLKFSIPASGIKQLDAFQELPRFSASLRPSLRYFTPAFSNLKSFFSRKVGSCLKGNLGALHYTPDSKQAGTWRILIGHDCVTDPFI
jgi:hypothetical protein